MSDLTLVKPRPEIVAAVDRYALEKSGAVGVHIRRTDHQRAIEYSPTELFIAAMREELAVDPQTRFFLATDSPEDEALLQQTFPGRILIHPKRSWRRSDPQAIRDAMIDLYALARCRKLIGSYWSSFTDTAAALGGMPVRIIKRA